MSNITHFTVSELNLASQKILEGYFSNIIVEGEISNLAKPTSGHLYFSLKDPHAQIRCAMFRQYSRSLSFDIQNGMMVAVKAKVSIYPDRGDYQLIVESISLAGDGLLRLAYEKLLKKLTAEGLLDPQYKKPIPTMPKSIGIISSPTGAAIRDILSVLKRRFPGIPVTLYPSKVQGAEAKNELVNALRIANDHNTCDVLILARGGGSLEDLWPFNEEIVALAIFASKIPIVTGIGHEIDFTIADFVADLRAATPSAAAELVSPNSIELSERFRFLRHRLNTTIEKKINYFSQFLDHLTKRLRHPLQHIGSLQQRLESLSNRLIFSMQRILREKELKHENLLRTLHTISPLKTLERGYSIVMNKQQVILRKTTDIRKGESLIIRMQDGEVGCEVS